MKYIAKMMLALLASVTLVVPAYAWDFSASGSASSGWKQTTTKPASGDSTTSANFSGSSGGVSLKSAHTDGDKSLTLTYSADVDTDGTQSTGSSDTAGSAGLDQTLSLSGSTKVGKWTSSATASQSLMEDGVTSKISGDDSAVITITDGSMTYKLGSAAHLSTAEKTAGTTAAGAQDAEARVDSFQGFSVGMPVGPGALTFAVDMNSGTASTLMGDKSVAIGCGGQMTGFGFNFAGNVGADLSLTYATGSSAASKTNCTGDNASNSASANTMGLGVAVPMGTITLALDYESTVTSSTVASTETKVTSGGYEISASIGGIADGTVVVNISSTSSKTGDADAAVTAGTELGWSTTIGATGFEIAYGSAAVQDGATTTELEIEMTLSF
jgi:hypothetical protein